MEVTIRGGTVRYSADAPPAVRQIDLDLTPGRRVALVGATGAGKSTVAAVLFRFVDLSSGAVLLNGRDQAGYNPDDVRAVISGCEAEPHIFDTTIRDNLRLARPQASDAGRTTLLITHDLDGLDRVDEIVVLDHGRVAERGTHAELARSGGAYQRLWQTFR